jgi:hypothetical protein
MIDLKYKYYKHLLYSDVLFIRILYKSPNITARIAAEILLFTFNFCIEFPR